MCKDFTKPADDFTYINIEEYIILVNEDGGNHVMEWDTNNGSDIYITGVIYTKVISVGWWALHVQTEPGKTVDHGVIH